MQDTLTGQKDLYKASQVQIQISTAEAWIKFKEGKNAEAKAYAGCFRSGRQDRKKPRNPG